MEERKRAFVHAAAEALDGMANVRGIDHVKWLLDNSYSLDDRYNQLVNEFARVYLEGNPITEDLVNELGLMTTSIIKARCL